MLRSQASEQSEWRALSDVASRVVGLLRPLRSVESAPALQKNKQQVEARKELTA